MAAYYSRSATYQLGEKKKGKKINVQWVYGITRSVRIL